MAYSDVTDLLLGDLVINPTVDKQKFVDQAAEEIDSKLGWLYKLPLEAISPATLLPGYQLLLLKGINNKLATGWLILTLDIAGEGTTLHAYGWALVREARSELMSLANGEVLLSATRIQSDLNISDKIPGIHNEDSESLLLGFENTVMRGVPWYSRPGKV